MSDEEIEKIGIHALRTAVLIYAWLNCVDRSKLLRDWEKFAPYDTPNLMAMVFDRLDVRKAMDA